MLFEDIDISKTSNVLMLKKICIIEMQNHRNAVWKGLLKTLSPPLPDAGLLLVPEQVGHGFVKSSPENLQALRLHNLSRQLESLLH